MHLCFMRFWYSTGLLLLLTLPFLGSYTWLQVQKKQARRAVKALVRQDMPLATLTHLVFNQSEANSELKWIHEREFQYQGILYDIFTSEECQGKMHYWLWPDHEETKLHQQLRNLLAQQSDLPVDKESKVLQFGKHWHYCFQRILVLPPLLPKKYSFNHQAIEAQVSIVPSTPPPRS